MVQEVLDVIKEILKMLYRTTGVVIMNDRTWKVDEVHFCRAS